MQDALQAFTGRLKRDVVEYWQDLRGTEILIVEAAEEFGKGPALPEIRRIIDWMRQVPGIMSRLSARHCHA